MIHSIRESTAADGARVNAVALAAFGQYAGDYDDWPAFSAGIGRMADLAADGDLLVAEGAGAVVGAIVHIGPGRPRNAAIYPAPWSVLRMLVVDPAQRGQGVGRALVHAALARALRAGAPVVGLHTSPIMASALRLYLGIGFAHARALAPIRGVPYALYVLAAADIPRALALLGDGGGHASGIGAAG